MSVYSEYRFWSPLTDCEAVRISMWNERDAEYFVIVKATGARSYRERRNTALEMIQEAISLKLDPGEVLPA